MSTNQRPLVSIIMPAYNAEKYIQESIESVLAQTYQNWELLIVNDASTDNTKAIINNYLSDPRIKIINHQKNKGLAQTRNTGIEQSTGEYITFLDTDDLWTPAKLERQIEYHRQYPEFPVSHTNYIIFKENGEIRRPLRLRFKPSFTMRGQLYKRLLAENMIGVLTVMIRADILKSFGGFDGTLRSAEDHDLWLRLSKVNIPFGYINESLARYRVHGNSLSRAISKFKRERKKLLAKHVGIKPDANRNSRIAWSNYYHHFAFEYKAKKQPKLALRYFEKSFSLHMFSLRGIIDIINIIILKYF